MSAPDFFHEPRIEMERLGALVRADRQKRDMSQGSYARLLTVAAGPVVDVPQLSRIERGQYVPEPLVGQAITVLLGYETPLQAPTPARRTDPATSHQNRPSASTDIHHSILAILAHYPDGLAHFEIINIYRSRIDIYAGDDLYPECTDQRIRTATHELVDAGHVVAGDEYHTNSRGRKCKTWRRLSILK